MGRDLLYFLTSLRLELPKIGLFHDNHRWIRDAAAQLSRVIGQNVCMARACQLRPAQPFLVQSPSSALRPVSYSAGPRGFSFTLGSGAGRGFLSCFWAVCQGWWGNSVKAFRCYSTAVRAWFSFMPRWRRRSSLILALTPPSRREVVRATVDFSSCW